MKRTILFAILVIYITCVVVIQYNLITETYRERKQEPFPHEEDENGGAPPLIHHFTRETPIRIIIQECCRTDLIELQLKLFKKFLRDPFELFMVLSKDASTSSIINGALMKSSKELGFNIKHCPKNDLDACLDFSFRTLVNDYDGYVMIANSDMFLWRNFSVKNYMKHTKCPMSALYEVHGEIFHFHPGLQILFPPSIPGLETLTWGKSGSDVGGATRFWVSEHKSTCVHPMIWSRGSDLKTLLNMKLIPVELFSLLQMEKGKLKSDLYLEGLEILHPRGGSNWQGDEDGALHEKFQLHFDFLRGRLDNKPLTWFNAGSSAIVHRDEFGVKELPNAEVVSNRLWMEERMFDDHPDSRFNENHNKTWLRLLFNEADKIKKNIEMKKILLKGSSLELPVDDATRTNLHLTPKDYDQRFYRESTVFYWKYVYGGDGDEGDEHHSLTFSSPSCKKLPGQKYWVATWGSGSKRKKLAGEVTIPSCLSKEGIDEAIFWTDEDLDEDFKRRNHHILNQTHGNGLWIWKHYVLYMMLERMNDGDVLFYLDSDMACSDDSVKFFCLTNQQDVVPFHHNHPWYTLSRLARRDAMIFMDLDFQKVAKSVQYSGGNLLIKKTQYSVRFIREMAAWSQQKEVIMGWGERSTFGKDWPEYLESGMKHQCDQAISSLMHVKYGHKSYPWRIEGFGSGSDDKSGKAERAEAGIPLAAKLIIDLN